MRLVAQAKGGFYAAPPAAISMAARWLQPLAKQRFAILDPCCGHGAAILQLADALACPMQDVYAIELDERRGNVVQKQLADERSCHVLAPASFFGTGISRKAFSLVWCNPPFDNELGGGQRVEHTFLERSTHLLVPGGVIALVCPQRVASGRDIQELLASWYTDLRMVEFPAEHRRFDEAIVFGVRREKQSGNASPRASIRRFSSGDETPAFRYRLPRSTGPTRFEKTEMTEAELTAAIAHSPLKRHLEVAETLPLPSPPMSLNKGHRAMLLAAGHLDGRVCPPGEPPHVVRGTAVKQSYVQSVETVEEADGPVTKTIIGEKIVLTVRVATADGRILTLTQGGSGDADKLPVGGPAKQRVAA